MDETTNLGSTGELVYRRVPMGEGQCALVFATPVRAALVDAWERAATESRTWGEFRARVGAIEAARIDREGFDDLGRARPANADAFDAEDVPGRADGDWPPWLAAEQEAVLPPALLARFGQTCESVFNGSFVYIDARHEAALLDALASHGIRVRRRDDLCFH